MTSRQGSRIPYRITVHVKGFRRGGQTTESLSSLVESQPAAPSQGPSFPPKSLINTYLLTRLLNFQF